MGTGAAGCRLPTKPLFSQLSDWAESRAARPGSTAFSAEKEPGCAAIYPILKRYEAGSDSTRISGSSLLKSLNSLYRPAGPEGIRGKASPAAFQTAIGASPSGKAVDFDSTIRRFESSRPSQAFLFLENFLSLMRKARQMRAFLIADSLQRLVFELFAPIIP